MRNSKDLDLQLSKITLKQIDIELARRKFLNFVLYMMPEYEVNWHHALLADKLDKFAKGLIKKLMVFMPPQHGKFLEGNTPVLTTKGFVAHKNLKIGDFVFNDKGQPVMVLANSGLYEWGVNTVEFAGGEILFAANEHLWKIKADRDDHKGRREFILPTSEIFKKRNRRAPCIDVAPCLNTSEKDLLIDPYLLGVWLGDGNSANSYLTCGSEDIGHFSKLGVVKDLGDGIYRILPNGLNKKLRLNNLLKSKHIPIEYILSSKEQRLELLRGLMDTDGCVDKKGRCEFCQKEGRLAQDVYILLRTLGFKPTIHTYDMKLNGRIVGKKQRILFSPNSEDIVFALNRKQDRVTNKKQSSRNDKYKFFFSKIDFFGRVWGNCIQVEGGMYLAGNSLIPTHNSQLASRFLPAYLLGVNPKSKIIACSYGADWSSAFNRDVQRIIDTSEYVDLFPKTRLNGTNVVSNAKGSYIRTSDKFEIVGRGNGFYKSAGVGGSITGNAADVVIIDDPIKNYKEAASATVRQSIWEWYCSDLSTRLHNNSQQLIIMTRWHQDDLCGHILREYNQDNSWEIFSLPAIKDRPTIKEDPRQEGEALWENKHSAERILAVKESNERVYQSMYQQDPKPSAKGLIYQYKLISNEDFESVNAPILYGLDLGFNDPNALIACKFKDKKLYLKEIIYKSGMGVTDLIHALKRNKIGKSMIIADSQAKTIIAELRKNGFSVLGVQKGSGSVFEGIMEVKEFELCVCENSTNTIEELDNYKWIEDAQGQPSETPIDDFNHACDAFRYATKMRRYTNNKASYSTY